jgi:glycosyltransferase involved in cell wall biosynthesis
VFNKASNIKWHCVRVRRITNRGVTSIPKVSVLLPSFNFARYLPIAIRSVLSQSYSDLELIITDDCSTDGSREIAEEWRGLDDRVITVFHDVNRGLAATRNSALSVSSGDFVAFCDADDIWLPHKLKVQMDCFRRSPEIGGVHSDSVIIDGEGNLTGQRFSSLFHRKGQKKSGDLFEELCQRSFLCVPTVILRREAIQYAGGFDARLRSLEDWVCWAKVSRKYRFYFVEEALVQYRLHAGGLSSNVKGMAHNLVKALQYLLESFSDISPRLRSRMLYSLGMALLDVGDSRGALNMFLKSVVADKSQFRSWVRCCQSLAEMARDGVRHRVGRTQAGLDLQEK